MSPFPFLSTIVFAVAAVVDVFPFKVAAFTDVRLAPLPTNDVPFTVPAVIAAGVSSAQPVNLKPPVLTRIWL